MTPPWAAVAVALLLGVVLAGCGLVPSAPAPATVAGTGPPVVDTQPPSDAAPAGRVTVAVPAPVVSWSGGRSGDLAGADLAGLWSLPLFRVDELGRPRPGLAVAARAVPAAEAWAVEVDLAAGSWSDGRPVTADDVVATARALADARPLEWAAFRGADAVDDHTLRLRFDRPFARWWVLLSEAPGVLPAHVLAERGLAAWDARVPVSGGPFMLVEQVPGVSHAWAAHASGPLGPPGLADLDVLVVPDVDVALGLLDDARVDAVVGHLALDPRGRAREVPGVALGLPFGGTGLELAWADGSDVDVGLRRAGAALLDPGSLVDGLLRDTGRPPGGVLPGSAATPPPDGALGTADARLAVDRTVEPLGLVARLLRRDLGRAGIDVTLLRVAPPDHLVGAPTVDGSLRVVRRGPLPSAAVLLDEHGLDPAPGRRADAAGRGGTAAASRGASPDAWQEVQRALAAVGSRVGIAEVAPVHVWAPQRLTGLTPSAWPGLAFWDVGAWRVP